MSHMPLWEFVLVSLEFYSLSDTDLGIDSETRTRLDVALMLISFFITISVDKVFCHFAHCQVQ